MNKLVSLFYVSLTVSCGSPSSNPCGLCELPKVCASVSFHRPCTVMGVDTQCVAEGHSCIFPDKVVKPLVYELVSCAEDNECPPGMHCAKKLGYCVSSYTTELANNGMECINGNG